MKKELLLKLICCILLMAATFLLSACGSEEAEEVPTVNPIEITITIDYPDKSKLADIKEAPFRVEEDSTVLQIIELYGNVNDIPILVETTHSTLEGINDVNNGLYAKESQWKYKVNSKYKNKSVNEMIIEDGDHLEFVFEYQTK